MHSLILKIFKNNFIRKNFKNKPLILTFLLGIFTGTSYIDFQKKTWYSEKSGIEELNFCFTPGKGCGDLIAKEIFNAEKDIYLQAYGLTSIKIIDQLIAAHKRNIKLHILVDKSNLTDQYSKIALLKAAGIEVLIDKISGIAHNKVIVIDRQKVITGSFNFTNDADKRNAENVVLINNKKVAKLYIENWHNRYNANQR